MNLNKLKIISIIGARPQFIKASPIELAFSKYPDVDFYSIHTGQHYDTNMSEIFFNQLKLKQVKMTKIQVIKNQPFHEHFLQV